jgi:H+-transporting ATPase
MARGQSDDIERNASVATRSKSIVSLTAFEGMDEYAALQKYIQFYRDPRAAQLEHKPVVEKKPWWKFWAAKERAAAPDASVVPDTVCALYPPN